MKRIDWQAMMLQDLRSCNEGMTNLMCIDASCAKTNETQKFSESERQQFTSNYFYCDVALVLSS